MQAIDQAVLQFFVSHRVEWLSYLMLVITYSGGYLVATLVTVLSMVSLAAHHHPKKILPLALGVVGNALTIFVLKNIFDKARPGLGAFYLESSFSFPSGHTAIAVALYGYLIYTIWSQNHHSLKKPAIWLLSILVILIGISRLYLGVHYLSDVLAGYAVGAIWLAIAIRISKNLKT